MLSIFFFNITSSAWLSIKTFKHFGIAVATIAFIRFWLFMFQVLNLLELLLNYYWYIYK